MNTLHFQYAVTVARTGSITQAAEELFMAQPNLSKAIRELEDSLGIEIFRRTPKGMVPTAQGEAFLRYAANVLEQVERMEALGRGDGGAQRFCVAMPHAGYIAGAAAQLIGEQSITGEIRVVELGGIGPLREVQEGRADLAILRYAQPQEPYFADLIARSSLNRQTLWEYDSRLTVHANHPLADLAQVDMAQLAGLPELRFYGEEPAAPQGGEGPRILFSDRAAIPGLLAATQGYLWSAPLDGEYMEQHSLRQPPCPDGGAGSRRWRDVLLYPKTQPLNQLYLRFVDLLYAARNALTFR